MLNVQVVKSNKKYIIYIVTSWGRMEKAKITISFVNRKGGVGKTTIATNLAQCLALIGKKVLVVDNDEQHNISLSLGIRKLPPVTLADLYEKPHLLPEAVVTTFMDGLDCICGSDRLSIAKPKKSALKDILSTEILNEVGYDFVIIDNGPSIDEKVISAISASDVFIIPLIMKLFSLQGLKEMVERLEKAGVTKDRIIILRNEMKNTNQYLATSMAVEAMYPENVLKTIIPYDDTLDGVLNEEKNIILSRSKAKASNAIIELVVELLGLDLNDINKIISDKRKKIKTENALKYLNQYRFKRAEKKESIDCKV